MRYFTDNEIEEIRQRLSQKGARDSDFQVADTLEGDESVAILQGGTNRRTRLTEILSYVIDHLGSEASVIVVDRGQWEAEPDEPYHFMSINSTTGRYEISDVWHHGCRWRCTEDLTTKEPGWREDGWVMIEGDRAFHLEIESSAGDTLDFDNFRTVLTLVGTLFGEDVTDDIDNRGVTWERFSYSTDGTRRTASDTLWNITRGSTAGKVLSIVPDDRSYVGEPIRSFTFKATVILETGDATEASLTVGN